MSYRYGTSPADVVVDRATGLPAAGVQLQVFTARGGQQVTAGLRDLDGNPLPGYLTTDADGRFAFTDDAERPNALWVLTPGGRWFSLVAEELRDQVGQYLEEFPTLAGKVDDFEAELNDFRPEVQAATARSIEALEVAQRANQTAALSIEPEWPLVIAHRGGADVWPEESREAMNDAARAGFPLEVDVRPLADGTLVCCHDDTVDRTMIDIPSGLVSDRTLAEWRAAKIKSPIIGGATGTPMTFTEWLDGYGGSNLLVPELKPGATDEEIDRFTQAILTRRLDNSLIAQSFDLAACRKIKAAGVEPLFLANAGATVDVDEVIDAGIQYIGTSKNRAPADVQAWKDAGLKVIAYTVKNRAEQIEKLALFDGVFSDDPWATSNRVPILSGDPFSGGHKPYGMQMWRSDDNAESPVLMAGSSIMLGNTVGMLTGTHSISMPWAGRLGNSLQVEVDIMFEQESISQTRNMGFFLLATPDDWPVDAAHPGQSGFTGLVRRSGQIDLYTYANGGAPTNVGAASTAAEIAPSGQQGKATIVFRLHANGAAYLRVLTDQGLTTTSTAQTGLQLNGDARLWLRSSGTSGKFLDVRISNPYL